MAEKKTYTTLLCSRIEVVQEMPLLTASVTSVSIVPNNVVVVEYDPGFYTTDPNDNTKIVDKGFDVYF